MLCRMLHPGQRRIVDSIARHSGHRTHNVLLRRHATICAGHVREFRIIGGGGPSYADGRDPAELRERLSMDSVAAALRLAVLHGSRARGCDGGVRLGYRRARRRPPDLPILSATLTEMLGTDKVDLKRASALLRYRAAREGIPLLERPLGEFQRFQLEAVQFWCDAETVIRSAHDDVLSALGQASDRSRAARCQLAGVYFWVTTGHTDGARNLLVGGRVAGASE